jgi:nicotinamidase-related amidase
MWPIRPPRWVGREHELAVLLAAAEALGRGEGIVVWIEGEPGIGKTALVAEALSVAGQPEWDAGLAGADQLTGQLPLRVMQDCLQVRSSSADPRRAHAASLLRGRRLGPLADHLITPENAAFLLIDYQPAQLAAIRSMDPSLLLKNAVSTVRTIKTFGVPVVHSTVNVASGRGQPTLPELAALLTEDKPLDRTTVNSWEDIEFVQAVHATGRRKLIICALWTEICMAFTALDALREGYEVYPVVDAIGGTSPEAHRAGLDRVMQAGGQPVSWVSLACELQRDWAREDTVEAVIEIVLTDRLRKE